MNITKVCSGWESGHSDNSHRTFDSSYDKVCVCDIDIPFGNNTKEYSMYSKLTINYKISFPKLFFSVTVVTSHTHNIVNLLGDHSWNSHWRSVSFLNCLFQVNWRHWTCWIFLMKFSCILKFWCLLNTLNEIDDFK